jgi:hypothetical protein
MQEVVLRPAFEWTCLTCSSKNFNRTVAVELTDDDRKEMMEDCDIEEDDLEDLYQAPAIVKCGKCLEKFKTVDPDVDIPDYEEDGK